MIENKFKKLVKVNPRRYEIITEDEAIKRYAEYMKSVFEARRQRVLERRVQKPVELKDFYKWLEKHV